MGKDIKGIIQKMTLEEKASLCTGKDIWHTQGFERLGIPSIMVADGPHGLRKQSGTGDHLGIYDSVPSTCFPTASALASSWDTDLIYKVGEHLGIECQAEDVSVLLGPGVNIKRSPICGRNFEYYSEDPVLSGKLGAAFVKGVQSQGVGTSLKHFAANNQEYKRLSISSEIDERTLYEIYLKSFEAVVKEAQPWTVMCAYNRLNGEFCAQNEWLLEEVLRNQWGFDGFVVSDWGAVDDNIASVKNGLELEMPGQQALAVPVIMQAIKDGVLKEEDLDRAVERILKIVFKAIENNIPNAAYDKEQHHQFARKAASESIILLKNEDNILPIHPDKRQRIAVIGTFAKKPRFQGGGSSHVKPTKVENALDEIGRIVSNEVMVDYCDGYPLENDEINLTLINEAKKIAEASDVALIFAGLPERYESEGYDRNHMKMPENHKLLIKEVAKVNPKTIVILINGSVIDMSAWIGEVPCVLEGWLGGQTAGGAIADVVFGRTSPCGKLAETIPYQLEHNPSYLNFPGDGDKVEYKEGIFVGYRYYDTKKIKPLFPFGFGLSYTSFQYSNLQLSRSEMNDTDSVVIRCSITNEGLTAGKEIVQLYVKDEESSVMRPEKELKAFTKIYLEPGETKEVSFELSKRDFAYYNTEIHDWHVETGNFTIMIGKSSREIVLKETIMVQSSKPLSKKYNRYSTVGEIMEHPIGNVYVTKMLERRGYYRDERDEQISMMMEFIKGTPICRIIRQSNGQFTEEMMDGLLEQLNN